MINQVNITFESKVYTNMLKGAVRKLKATGAKHVVFGVKRVERGYVNQFYIPCTDDELYELDRIITGHHVFCVHASQAKALSEHLNLR